MQPVTPERYVSHRERQAVEVVLEATLTKILQKKIPASQIIVSGRPMRQKILERLKRREFEDWSLRRAYLLADSVGIDINIQAAA